MKHIGLAAALAGGFFLITSAASADQPVAQTAWYKYLHAQLQNAETDAQFHAQSDAELDRWIAAVNAAPDGAPPHKLDFEAKVNFSHSTMINRVPLEVLYAYVDQLKEAGATRIALNPTVDIWVKHDQPTIDKYIAFVKHIRSLGLQLAVQPQSVIRDVKYDSFTDWQTASLKAETEMAALFKPDVFILVHEPSSLTNMTGLHAGVADWTQFVELGAKMVHEVSPNSKVGAGVFAPEIDYFRSFANVKGLDVLTMDIYDYTILPTYIEMARIAHEHGKEVYIEEAWRVPFRRIPGGENPETVAGVKVTHDVLNKIYEDLDRKMLTAEVLFAEKYGLTGINADRTEPFFLYLPYSIETQSPKAVALITTAIMAHKHTTTFDKFRELSGEYGKAPVGP